MEILRLTNKDKSFYSTMGACLANRQIEKDVGYRIYDDDGKEWIIAKKGRKIIGFCYIWKRSKSRFDIGSCWAPQNGGVFESIFSEATSTLHGPGVVTIAVRREEFKTVILEAGFTVKNEMKNITEYIKELPDENEQHKPCL